MSSEQTSHELVERGLAALDLAQFDDAIELFERAALEDSASARAWFYLGLCYLETGRAHDAIEALNRALAADPEYADVHYLRGTAMGASGQTDEAARCYRRALEIEPSHHKAEEFLIKTEALLASREHYRQAVRLIYAEPREADWFNRAVRELLHSVAIFNGSPATSELRRLGNEVIQSGKMKAIDRDHGAERDRQVEGGGDPFWKAAVVRAEQAFARKNWPEAAASYHEALDLEPDHAFIHHALGLTYFALGDTEGGTAAWHRALDLDCDYDFSAVARVAG